MSQFYVAWNALQNQSSDIVEAGNKIKNIEARLEAVKSNLNGLGKYAGLTGAMTSIITETQKEAASTKALGKALGDITRKYQKTENKISGISSKNQKVEKAKSEGSTDDSTFNWKWDSLGWKIVSKFGVVGTAIAGFGEMVTGGVTYKTLLGGANKYVSILGDLAKNAYSSNPNCKNVLFGGIEGAAWVPKSGNVITTKAGIFKESFEKQLTDFTLENCDNVGDKIKVGTKWAGVAISGITNAISNYEEMGTVKSERFWAETITETAVDVGIGIVSTAAATALIGTAAPAVAVGALAVGAVWAVDGATRFMTEKFTGEEKGLTEFISDGILDIHSKVADVRGKAISDVGNAIKNTGKTLGKWCAAIL